MVLAGSESIVVLFCQIKCIQQPVDHSILLADCPCEAVHERINLVKIWN